MSVSSATAGSVGDDTSACHLEESQFEAVYETQYFSFTPKSFSNGMYNAVNEYMRDGLEAMDTYINTEYGHVMSPDQVNDGIQKMQQRMAKQVDRAFDTLEVYLFTNIFCIPENSVLPEDEAKQEKIYTDEDERRIKTDIEQYHEKILAVKYANTCLSRELKDIDTAQKVMDKMLSQAHDMNQLVKKSGVTDVKDSLVFGAGQTLKKLEVLEKIKIVSNTTEDVSNSDEDMK